MLKSSRNPKEFGEPVWNVNRPFVKIHKQRINQIIVQCAKTAV